MPNLKQKEDAGDDADTGETSLDDYALWALAIIGGFIITGNLT